MRGLLISIAFPPKNDPECIQTARMFKFLSKDPNITWDVVTAKPPILNMPEDRTLMDYDNGYEQKVEIPIKENRYLNFIQRKICSTCMMNPDSKKQFIAGFESLIRTLRITPDFVYSRSFPMSSAYLAHKVSIHFGIPWFMHMSDPWLVNPMHTYSGELYKKLSRIEHRFFKQARFISFTSENTRKLYQKTYPVFSHKMGLVPNVFDDDLVSSRAWRKKRKLIFTYVGSLAVGRKVDFLLENVTKWIDNHAEAESKVEFLFYGSLDRPNRKLFRKYKHKAIKHNGRITYKAAMQAILDADVLMTMDAVTDEDKAVFFPSKLLDYAHGGAPVLAVAQPDSPTSEWVNQQNGMLVPHHDISSLHQALDKCWNAWNSANDQFFAKRTAPAYYSARHQAAEYTRNIIEMMSGDGG